MARINVPQDSGEITLTRDGVTETYGVIAGVVEVPDEKAGHFLACIPGAAIAAEQAQPPASAATNPPQPKPGKE